MGDPDVNAFQIGIRRTRQELYSRIDREVEDMIERGWIDEIRELLRKGVSLDAPAMTSIGYRELISYIKGEKPLDDAVAACKTAVRRYAKRQETWYRRDKRIHWAASEKEAIKMVGEFFLYHLLSFSRICFSFSCFHHCADEPFYYGFFPALYCAT